MTDVLVPTSAEEAATAFGDGSGITVLAGGTLVVPAIKLGRLRPVRTLFLGRAGLGGIESANGTVKIGATTPTPRGNRNGRKKKTPVVTTKTKTNARETDASVDRQNVGATMS